MEITKETFEFLCRALQDLLNRPHNTNQTVTFFSGIVKIGWDDEHGKPKRMWAVKIKVNDQTIFSQSHYVDDKSNLEEVEKAVMRRTMIEVFNQSIMTAKNDLEKYTLLNQ